LGTVAGLAYMVIDIHYFLLLTNKKADFPIRYCGPENYLNLKISKPASLGVYPHKLSEISQVPVTRI